MNILHISTFEGGGAGIAAGRLHRSLRELGHDSTMLVRDRAHGPTKKDVVTFDAKCKTLSNPLLDEFLLTTLKTGRADGVDYYFSTDRSTRDVASLDVVRGADIINVHWIAETVSTPALRAIQDLGKPVVWTIHDQFPFTGGCHYSGACDQYTTGCHACPHVRGDVQAIPAFVMAQKRAWMDPARLSIVSPSQWLAACARRSLLLGEADIRVIPYSLPVAEYQRLTQSEARAQLKWPADAVILLFGADSIGEQRKGFAHLGKAMRRLAEDPRFAPRVANRTIFCATFGDARHGQFDVELPTLHLGRLSTDGQLAAAYAAADMFILPTLEDNLPNTMLESISAGTPVVAYGSGGVPDILQDRRCGVLVPSGDVVALGDAIAALIDDVPRRTAMRDGCRAFARERLDLPIQGRRYLELYDTLLARPARRRRRTTGLSETEFADQEVRLLSDLLDDRALVAAPFKAFRRDLEKRKTELLAQDTQSPGSPWLIHADAGAPQRVFTHMALLEERMGALKNLDADLTRQLGASRLGLAHSLEDTRNPLEWLLKIQTGSSAPPANTEPGARGVVSVIVPVYNGARYLEEAIRSVWSQSLPANRIEIVVVDDGSTDGSFELARRLQRRSPQRMQVLRHPGGANRGVSATRNLALAHCVGEFIALLDADDAFEPERLKAGVRYLERHRTCEALCSYGTYVDERDKPIDGPNGTPIAGDYRSLSDRLAPPYTFDQLWELYLVVNSTLLIRRTAIAAAGGYAEEMAHQAEDRLLVLKLSLRQPVHLLRRKLIRYRHHASNFTTQYVEHGFEPGVQLELLYHLVHWMVHAPQWRERGLALFRRHYPKLLARSSKAAADTRHSNCACTQAGMDAKTFLATRQRETAELDTLRRAVPAALAEARDVRAEVERLRAELRRGRRSERRGAKAA